MTDSGMRKNTEDDDEDDFIKNISLEPMSKISKERFSQELGSV